jgi:hypothetical protein
MHDPETSRPADAAWPFGSDKHVLGLDPAIMVKQWVSDKPVSNCGTGLISDFKDIHKILLLGKKRRTQPSPWIVRAKSGKADTDFT